MLRTAAAYTMLLAATAHAARLPELAAAGSETRVRVSSRISLCFVRLERLQGPKTHRGSVAKYDATAVDRLNVFNQLVTSDSIAGVHTAFAYDLNGNLLSTTTGSAGTTYGWTKDNRLSSVTPPTGPATSNSYDAFGARIERIDAAGTTRYLLDGQSVLEELDGASATSISYLNNPKQLDEVFAFKRAGAVAYPLTDGLGSVYAIADASGGIGRRFDFDAYGARADLGGGVAAIDVGFTGRWHDGDGLIEYRDRFFSPREAVFLGPDRVGMIAGPNLYSYVKNMPTMATDPTGRTLSTYSGPTKKLFNQFKSGGRVLAGELYGNGAQVDKFLDGMRGRGYSFSFFSVFDAVVGFGSLSVTIPLNPPIIVDRQAGATFAAGECAATPTTTAVIDIANVLLSALDLSADGKTTSVEEVIAHELGHVKGLAIFGLSSHADQIEGMSTGEFACDEEREMHFLMYGGDPVAAERTWAGCTHD